MTALIESGPTRRDEAWRYADLKAVEALWPPPPARLISVPAGAAREEVVRVQEGGIPTQAGLYEQIGGTETFDRLVRTFYDGVQTDPVLWPMYPHQDLEGAIHRLSTFLQQYWGGPTTYSDERGHPRLRQRHVAFKVNPDARDRWLFPPSPVRA